MSDIFMEQAGGYGGISAGQLVNGVLTATVTNTKDPEKLGRIKVQFLGQGTDNETDWIRVAAFAAGSSKGAFFLPEVGEEVLVAFIQGSVDRPVVIGALWEKTDKPPEDNADGKNNIKMLKTRAGHTVTFDDDTQTKKAKIEIKSSAGHIITLDDAAGKEKIEIKDKSGQCKIIMDAVKKSITIQSAMRLDIKADMIIIDAKSFLTLKGGLLKAEAKGTTEIKGKLVQIN
jgi:phage baseplate assembly protein V